MQIEFSITYEKSGVDRALDAAHFDTDSVADFDADSENGLREFD